MQDEKILRILNERLSTNFDLARARFPKPPSELMTNTSLGSTLDFVLPQTIERLTILAWCSISPMQYLNDIGLAYAVRSISSTSSTSANHSGIIACRVFAKPI